MAKAGTADDDLFPELKKEKPAAKRGRQEDGTFITSSGEVLPAKEERRVPYDEPEDKQVDGNRELVQDPTGEISFLATRMTMDEFRAADYPERKRLKCMYRVDETYSGKPRPYYSYDELEQLRKGELKR